MDDNNIDHHRMSVELNTPKGKATPFLKCTFLTQNYWRNATTALNAICATRGYIILLIEPREVQSWLPMHKKNARNHILSLLNEKGYRFDDREVVVICKWIYSPFLLLWNLKI